MAKCGTEEKRRAGLQHGTGRFSRLLRTLVMTLLLVFARCEDTFKNKITLTFLVDSTGSMGNDIKQVKVAMKDIFDYLKTNRPDEIENYALVEFNDPDAKLVIITNDAATYRSKLESIKVGGGEDCAEMAMKGLKIALESSLPYSSIYVFTDASAKDYDRKEEIENIIQRKKSKVVFVLTGICDSESNPDYQVFHSIAKISNGHVFNLHKDEVHKVLEFIKIDTGSKNIVNSGSIPSGSTSLPTPVDGSMKEFTVTVTLDSGSRSTVGGSPKVDLKNPDGVITPGRKILDLDNVVSKQVQNPKPGIWTVDVGVRAPGRFVITAETTFNFKYGFSLKPTEEISDTAPRPLAGIKNELLIKLVNNSIPIQLSEVKVKDKEGNVLKTIRLHPIRSKNGIYRGDAFLPPDSVFLLEVHGKDAKNYPVVRISDSGIIPQQPAPPIITLPTDLTATLKSPFTLTCHVESLVPFTGSWYKGKINLAPEKTFQQSTKMHYHINNTTESTEGIYQCHAKNRAGSTSRDVKLKVKGPPPSVITPKGVLMILNQKGEIPCQVESDTRYEIKWEKQSTSGVFLPVRDSKASVQNGHLILARADKGDDGIYVCSAKSIFGEGKSEVKVEVLEAPTVTVSRDQQFIENESFQISCKASGTVPINLTWKKNGITISELDKRLRRMDGNVLLYTIKNSQQSDEGIYECTATNKANSASGITKLKYVQVVPQIDKEESGEKVLIVGEAKELPCKIIQGIPKPSLTWYKDGEKLAEDDRQLRGTTVFTNGSLVLSYAKPENEGVYECEAENVAGKARKTFHVRVLEPPTFSDKNHTIFKVKPGMDVLLPCEVYGNPKPMISWRKDNAELTSSNIALGSNGNSIFIMASTPKNNGTYECIATNAAGENVHYIDVFVQGTPIILPQSTHVYPNKGDEITLKCMVIAYPISKIKWLKNGSPYKSHHVSYGENNSTIRIRKADLSSSGKYECIASNERGQDNITINVQVTVPPSFEKIEEFIQVSKGETVTLSCETEAVPPAQYSWVKYPDEESSENASSITFGNVDINFAGIYQCRADHIAGYAQKLFIVIVYTPPRIETFFLEKYIVQIGRNFSLPCFAEGYPTPNITWLKNGKNVTHFKESVLDINDITPEDEGIYTCVAENYEGTDQRNIQVIVEVPPKMAEVYQPVVEVNESTSVTISCPAMSGFPPPTVRWAKDGKEIRATKLLIPKDKYLKLKRMRLDDGGIYSCIASNRAGEAQANITVDVLKAPLLWGGKYKESINGIVGKSYKLDCSNFGKPTPKVSWFRNNHPFVHFLSPQATKESNNQILRINNASKSDEGLYKCVVENNAGSTVRMFDLKLLSKREQEGILPDEDRASEWGEWSSWSQCSAPCGHSEQVRVRRCKHAINRCPGDSEEWRKCNVGGCKVDGSWSKWTAWTECTASCGSSVRYRERNCSNPYPLYGGDLCYGANRQHETCNKVPCPIDGGWSQWSKWHTCFGSCAKSFRKRERRCKNPYPAFDGKPCVGPNIEHKSCTMASCPVNGGWSEWTPWSPCSASCGPSHSFRERLCNNPAPKLNGLPCEGSNTQTRKCESPTCDNIPLHLSLKFIGSLNGQDIPEHWYHVNITDLKDVREVKSIFQNPIKKKALPIWYPFLPHIVGPVTWLTAFQQNNSVNGYTLTDGVFEIETIISFKSGESVSIHHTGSGFGSGGLLHLQAYIEGQNPLFNNDMVDMDSYEETYIQSGPGELLVLSQNPLDKSGVPVTYSWTKTIKYNKDKGRLPSLAEKLTVRRIQTRSRNHKEEGMISSLSESCPLGFEQSELRFCLDVDECSNRQLHNCHPSQSCVNTIGSYKCLCPPGFESSRKGEKCTDINECNIHPSVCSHWCENFQGSFKCLCPPGLATQESKTNCTVILSKHIRKYGDSSSMYLCSPGQKEKDGICRDNDPCMGSERWCKEGEMCVNERRLAKCIPLPCPDGFTRIKNTQCIKNCNIMTCETHANVSETISHIILKLEGPVPPYVNLIELKWETKDGFDEITHHILKNEKGKPFHVRSLYGIGHLFSTQFLPSGRTYSIEILASIYNPNGSRILHTNKFLVTIYTLDIV